MLLIFPSVLILKPFTAKIDNVNRIRPRKEKAEKNTDIKRFYIFFRRKVPGWLNNSIMNLPGTYESTPKLAFWGLLLPLKIMSYQEIVRT